MNQSKMNYINTKGIGRAFLFVFIISIASVCKIAYAQPADSLRIKKLISELGDIDNSVNFMILDTLKDLPDKYWICGKLITELDTTEQPAYEDGKNALGHYKFKALHTIWCWRALRMLTSVNFYGSSKQTLEGVYGEYLLDKESGKIKYCHVWPLKSIIYMAPGDAQLDIINQWKDWYSAKAKKFDYKTLDFQSTLDF